MTPPPLRVRAAELGLDDSLVDEWEPQVAADVVDALLSSLIVFEDALRELGR